jgi:class 3 adenylate cyclase
MRMGAEVVVGETPNLAVRLRELAGPGARRLAPTARRLVGGGEQITRFRHRFVRDVGWFFRIGRGTPLNDVTDPTRRLEPRSAI